MDATEAKHQETWDRLVLLLIALPREGWEHEFREITRREIHWLSPRKRPKRDMMSSPVHIIYTPRPDTTAEAEAAALACVYRYILRCYEEKEAAKTVEASEHEKGGGGSHDLSEANAQRRPQLPTFDT